MLNDVYFEFPALLHLLWALPLQALLLWVYWRWRKRTLRLMGSVALEERLLLGFSSRRFWVKNLLFAAGIGLVSLAIAGPVQMVKDSGKTQNSADVLIALDVSNSMLATDVKPNRLEQAKDFIQKLVQALEGERIALVFFAGEAYPQMPLSTDYDALLMFVRNANPDFITDQGTDIGAAVELGKRMLETDKETGRAIILVSDGENHEEKALQRVREAHEAGVLIYSVGIGSAGGATIPSGRGALQRDFNGQAVRSVANESMMLSVAKAGAGQSLNIRDGNRAIETIKKAVQKLQKTAVEASASSRKIYYFPWILLAALFVLIGEQVLWWKKKIVVPAIAALLMTSGLSAQSVHNALLQGEKNYDSGNYEKAQKAYQSAGNSAGFYNAGNAAIQLNNLTEAVGFYRNAAEKSTSAALKADALYNLGNALLLQKKYPEAIKAYESSLRLLPNRPDAQKNLQIAKRPPPPPTPPSPPPPPPPPPSTRPRQTYLDKALEPRQKEIPPANIPPEMARQMLARAVLPEEQKNARAYRELSPANRPSRLKKDW